MSTRSYICVKQDDGSYKGVYCHWDGYLTYNGAMLIDHYNSLEKANEILALGDISSLKENLYPDPAKGPHSFDYGKQQEGVTIAYGRDRGETGTEAKTVDLKILQSDDSWIDYIYVFEDGRWKYFEYGQLSEGLKDVDEDLHEYYASKGVKRPENFYGYLTDPSHSNADYAMCSILSWWTNDYWQIDRIFRGSGLYRDKWDSPRGNGTYGSNIIEEVMRSRPPRVFRFSGDCSAM